MQEDIEPLPADLWFERIEMIANGELASTESALRHALHLLQLSPPECRPSGYVAIDEERYETLLEAGDLDAAARCLLWAPTLTVNATSTAGGVEVSLGCKSLKRTIVGKGDSVATAILQAWTKCLLTLRSKPGSSCLSEAAGH